MTVSYTHLDVYKRQVLALYTQYYAGFLAAGLTVAGLVELWRQRRKRQAAVWLGAQAVVALLFLPWVLYAGPKLVSRCV